MATLYRKYRPQNFEEVVGQSHIKLTLEHEIEAGKLAHAYLFCGPRAVGKTTLARVLAKAVNCENRKEGEHEPCDKCNSCKDIVLGRSFDIIEIDAASHTGVDNVRENIIAQARVAPTRFKHKVFIIDEVHMLSISAFNALLKVLEEPPMNVIFVLCTTEIHKVPTTIISRCQRFDFKRISMTDVVKKLSYIVKTEKIKIEKDILEAIARQSEGYMRDAESLLGQIVSIGGKEITREEADLVIPRSDLGEVISLIDFLAKKDASSSLGLINKLIDQGVDLKTFLKDLIEILRKMMFSKLSPNLADQLGMELGESLEMKINKINKDLNLNSLILFIESFVKAMNDLRGSFIIQLPIEIAIVRLCAGVSQSSNIVNLPKTQVSLESKKTEKPIINSAPIAKTVNASFNTGDVNISEKWHEVLAKVKKHNHSLSFILRVCEPRELNGNVLSLAFKYKFHKERVSDPKIRVIVEQVLTEVYSTPLVVVAVIDESLEIGNPEIIAKEENVEEDVSADISNAGQASLIDKKEKKAERSDMIDNLLKTFGGKVVN